LLDYAYSKCKIVPVVSGQISKNGDPGLYVFSILLELGYGDLIDKFQRLGHTGGTATLWQVEVLENYVDHRLREVAASAQRNDSKDTLGYVSDIISLLILSLKLYRNV